MPFWMSAMADGRAATARLMSVAALSTASSSVRAWPSADSAARTASTSPVWRPTGRDTRLRRVGDVLVGERQPLLGGFDVAGDGSQCGIGELVVQRGQRLLRRFQPRGQIDHLLGHRIQPGRRVDDQIPQLLERLPLGVELAVGLGRRDDHPGQQVATLRRRLGDGVVEDLADVERLRQRRLRVGDRLAERRGLLVAEFLDSQGQFVVAGAHGVVDVDHHRLGQVVERVDLNRRQRVRVGGIHPPRRRELGLPALAASPPRPHHNSSTRTDEDGQRDEQSEPGDPCCPGRSRC